MVYYSAFGSRYSTVIFKYFLQTIETFIILLKYKPNVVFVMSPPLFACAPVFIYCRLFNKKYIIDAHTGAFKNNLWQKAMWLQKFFSKNATVNIITNNGLIKYLTKWNAPFILIPDVPIIAKNVRIQTLKKGWNVTLINTFAVDEPLEEFLEAAKSLPNIYFYITGKIRQSSKRYIKMAPKNVKFTDFLDDADYFGLMLASDIIVVLTKLDNTMQRGAYEAIYNEKPIITSKWDVLRENFSEAGVFVDNTTDGIIIGIQKAIKSFESLNKNAKKLKKAKMINWERNKTLLRTFFI